MKMRLRTLWRVPVYCLIASWISFYATVYLARFFFVVKSVGADGVTNVSADPVRSTIFHAVLFLAVLLIGGLWAFRSMTRAEIAVSAAIMTAVYLSVVLFQLNLPDFSLSWGLTLAKFQNWSGIASSLLMRLTDQLNFSVIAASFVRLLFIPFGQSKAV